MMKLRTRLSLVMVALVLVTGLTLALLISSQIANNQKLDHARWSASLTSALAKAVFRDTLAGNRAEVIASLNRTVASNPEIAYLVVVDFNGKSFAEVNKLKQSPTVVDIDHVYCKVGNAQHYEIGRSSIRDQVYPLIENLPAHLHVGFDLAYEAEYLDKVTHTVLTITLILLFVSVALALLMANRISHPITRLAQSMREYGRGVAIAVISPKQADIEVQELVNSFQSMTEENTRALQALQGERNFIDTVLDNAGALVVVLDREGRIRRFNRACETLSGYNSGEVEGKFPWDVVLPAEDVDTIRTQAFEALKEDPTTLAGNFTNYWVSKSGERFLIEWKNTPLRDDDGAMEYLISVGKDITAQRIIEDALRSSEARLRDAQRIAHIGGWELDLVTNKLHWTDEIYHIFEVDPSRFEASYEAFLNAIHPEDRDAVNKAYTDSLKQKAPYEISHRLLMVDGRLKWVNERCESFFDNNGKPVRSVGTVQDITERVRIEQELRDLNHSLEIRVSERTYELASERNFISTILDTANALVIVLDNDGRVVRFNRACELLTGYSQKELQGQVAWEKLVPVGQRDTIRGIFSNLSGDTKPSHYELEWISKDGERRFIAWSNSTIKNTKGEVTYVIETGIDITARKAAELALIEARDKAEQASRAKSEFLARMSHELRTPLNAILGFSQLLETDVTEPLNPIQQDSVQEISHAGNHLLELINEILDLSRIEAGRMQLSMEPVALEPLLRASTSLIQTLAEQRNISVEVEPVSGTSTWVMADAIRLKQVLLNLLSNAVKYNSDGGKVRIACSNAGEDQIRIDVSDSGFGMSDEQLKILFEPFERLDADTKAIQGTGIGLALSKRLTEMMGGSIGVTSAQGKGSTFWVCLARSAGIQ